MFARILLRFWPTTFKNPVCWGFCIHCGQPSAKAAASPRDILHRARDRMTTCLILFFMGFSFLERLGLELLTFKGKASLGRRRSTCQEYFCWTWLAEGKHRATERAIHRYSVRNAVIGVTRVARCAGKKQARSEAAASMRLDVISANGSFGLTS